MSKKIIITVPTLKAGGMERAAVNFANSFALKDFEVYIFTISSDIIFYDLPSNVKLIIGKKEEQNRLLTLISLLKLRRVTKKIKPDFVFSLSGKMSVYVILSLLFSKVKVIPFHRGNPYIKYGFVNNILNNIFYPKTKYFAVQTLEAGSFFKKKYNLKNVILIPNPIRDIDLTIEYKTKRIITVTRLVNGKGLFELIDIFNEINSLDWEYYIVGDGYLMNDLRAYIKKLKLENNIFLLGFQKDVDEFLSKASIFAFASESEGFPNSLLEAMCGGLACISYDCPTGPADMIVNNVNGFLIDMGNKIEFKQKLKILMESISTREIIGLEAKKLKNRHNPEIIIDNFLKELN